MAVVLYGPVRSLHSACSRWARIRAKTCRIEQTVAGRIPQRGVKGQRIKYGQLVIRLVGIGQVGIPNTHVNRQTIAELEVVVEIKFQVLPTSLLLENDVLFAPIYSLVLQEPIGRAIVSSRVCKIESHALRISNILAALVTTGTKAHALFL